MSASEKKYLKTGAEFKASLQDDRTVFYKGEKIQDVTTHPATSGGINIHAKLYDDQHKEGSRDKLTYIREDGARVSTAWMIPRTKEQLVQRRESIEYIARETYGIFGRPLDLMPTIAIGMAAYLPTFRSKGSEYAENVLRYINYAQENNIMGPEVLVDPQNDRSKAAAAGDRLGASVSTKGGASTPALLRVVKENSEGIFISGAKAVGSISSQGNEMILSNLLRPNLLPEESLWLAVPINTPGLTMVCREMVSKPESSAWDHPIASRGEEMDSFLLFDDVFVPKDRIFNYGVPELNGLYGPVTVGAHWHILSRLCVKAELFSGLAQMIVDALGTGHIAGVRTLVAEVIQYAQVLRAFVLASEEKAQMTEGGVMWPDVNMLTAGRLYGIEHYPKVLHILRELCGQGLVMRLSESDFAHPVIGPRLDWILEGHNISAKDKNLLMNVVWDLTTDSHSGRVGLFENVNALPAPLLKERLYREYDREPFMSFIRKNVGLPE
jgi:4-hydroxyphenylacetate 3-monooxygenase